MFYSTKRLRFRVATAVRRTLCLACVGALLLSGGCALRHGDYALDGKLRIELAPPSGPLFYGVQVVQRAEEIIVSGFGRRPTPRGHVEIAVTAPDGTSLALVRAESLPPRAVPNWGYNYRFKSELPLIPPAGSTLRVKYVSSDGPRSGATGDRPRAKRVLRLTGRHADSPFACEPLTGRGIAD